MAIITIARETGCLAEEIATGLSGTLGYRNIDKDALESRLSTMSMFGVSNEKREKFDERKPGFWASLSQERDTYLHFLKTAVVEEALGGDCIFMGRGAGAILKGVPNLVSIRLTSPMAVRVERIRASHSCSDKTALDIIEKSDQDRRGFHKYFFALNWDDGREYDLVLNTGRIDARSGIKILLAAVGECADPGMDGAQRERLADILLAQNVLTEIVYKRKLAIHFLEAQARAGHVVLHGVSNTQNSIDAAVAAAQSVEGVKAVESAVQIIQEFSVIP